MPDEQKTYRVVVICPSCNRHSIEISSHQVQAGFVIERECPRCHEFDERHSGGHNA